MTDENGEDAKLICVPAYDPKWKSRLTLRRAEANAGPQSATFSPCTRIWTRWKMDESRKTMSSGRGGWPNLRPRSPGSRLDRASNLRNVEPLTDSTTAVFVETQTRHCPIITQADLFLRPGLGLSSSSQSTAENDGFPLRRLSRDRCPINRRLRRGFRRAVETSTPLRRPRLDPHLVGTPRHRPMLLSAGDAL